MSRKQRRRKRRKIIASSQKQMICMLGDVTIKAADGEGESKAPPSFSVVAYTGGAMQLGGWDRPVVVDLEGITPGKSLVANLDHDNTKRVGNVTGVNVVDGQLILSGSATAATEARREVVESAAGGFTFQASIEAIPDELTEVDAGKSTTVNGQEFHGPLYVASKSTLKGFAFVSHGADDNTQVSIAASAGSPREKKRMDPELKKWIEAMGFVAEDLSTEQLAGLQANYEGQALPPKKKLPTTNPFEARKLEAKRRAEIRDIADHFIDLREADLEEIEAIEKMHDHAIEAEMSAQEFRLAMYEAGLPKPKRFYPPTDRRLNGDVLQAAICQAGRLPNIEKHFSDQTLQAAKDQFNYNIGLKQLFQLAAKANGHDSGFSSDVSRDTLRAAFAGSGRKIHAGNFSTLDIGNVTAATANKFIMRGWSMVDQTPLRIAKIQNVRDFKTATTVSLTDSVIYDKVGAAGEIPHGTLSDLTYTNKADTYAKMLAITRQDIINDDLGALTDVPMKLGAGAMKKLNDIFWTEFLSLVGSSFFASGNSNINTGVATVTEAGLDATYVIFKNQTNPDGTPLGVEPAIILVPTALEGAARRLVRSEQYITGTDGGLQGSTNIWANRFTVETSPYISNSTYTGNTSVAWWLLANPNELPVIAIAALNGRVEPTVDTAEADFNVLGVQMRGYSDVGVNQQEYRGGVHADGGAS